MRFIVSLCIVVATLALGVLPASATDVLVEAPDEAAVGETVEISVELTDLPEGEESGIEVMVRTITTVAGERGTVILGSAFTDEHGVAVVEFVESAVAGETQPIEVVALVGAETPSASTEIAVADGPQLVDEHAPVSLPVFSVWWILGVLALVWVVLIYAVSRLLVIRRASTTASGAARWVPSVMVGFVTFTAIGMAVVILNRPQSHANLEPTVAFDRAPAAVLGVSYEYDGLGLSSVNGLDGQKLYEAANCSGCHGINGAGAVVGGALEGEILADTDAFLGEVRRGPASMPTYLAEQLSDDSILAIVAFLEEAQ